MRLVSGVDETLLIAIAQAGRSSELLLWLSHLASSAGGATVRLAIAVAAIVLLFALRRWRDAMFVGGAVGTGALVASLLKAAIDRPRPTLLPWLDNVSSASLPSGHAWNSVILFGALALVSGRRWTIWIAAALALATGVSRIILGVHWPSDVAAGWLGGLAWLLLWYRRVGQREVSVR